MAYLTNGPLFGPDSEFTIKSNGNPKMGNGRDLVIVDAQKYGDSYNLTILSRNDVFDMQRPWQADPNPYLVNKTKAGLFYENGAVKTYLDANGQSLPKFKTFHDFRIRSKEQLAQINKCLPNGKTVEEFVDQCKDYRTNHNGRSPENDAAFLKDNALCFKAPIALMSASNLYDRLPHIQITSVEGINTVGTNTPVKHYTNVMGKMPPKNATISFRFKTTPNSPVPDSPEVTMKVDDFSEKQGLMPRFKTKTVKEAEEKAKKNESGLTPAERKVINDWVNNYGKHWNPPKPGTESFDLEKHNANTVYTRMMCNHYAVQDKEYDPNREKQRVDGMKYTPGNIMYVDYETFMKDYWPEIRRSENMSEVDNPLKAGRREFAENYVAANGTRKGLPYIYQISRDDKVEEQVKEALWMRAHNLTGFDQKQMTEKDLAAISSHGINYSKLESVFNEVAQDTLSTEAQAAPAQAEAPAEAPAEEPAIPEVIDHEEEPYASAAEAQEVLRNLAQQDIAAEEDFDEEMTMDEEPEYPSI